MPKVSELKVGNGHIDMILFFFSDFRLFFFTICMLLICGKEVINLQRGCGSGSTFNLWSQIQFQRCSAVKKNITPMLPPEEKLDPHMNLRNRFKKVNWPVLSYPCPFQTQPLASYSDKNYDSNFCISSLLFFFFFFLVHYCFIRKLKLSWEM